MGNAELFTNFAQIAWLAAFILANGGVADDLQVRDPAQIRQDLILHAISEVRVLFVIAQIFKRQNRDRFHRGVDRCMLRRGSRVATEKKQSNRYNCAGNYYINPGVFLFSRSCGFESTSSVRLSPSGVSSNAQAKPSATGRPSMMSTTIS